MSKKNAKRENSYTYNEHENIAHYDWRLAAVTTLTETVRGPSGKMHEAGAPVVAICQAAYDSKTVIRFNMPSVCALLLDHANRLWGECSDLIGLFKTVSDDGRAVPSDDSALMELIEKRMTIVVFSHTAIEAFANEVIENAYIHDGYAYSQPNPKTGAPYSLEEIERYLELETKLCAVLPEITGGKNPKGTSAWQRFGKIRKIRHYIIHPKVPDRIQRSPEEEALWKLLTDSSFRNFALDAKALMMHYAADGSYPARWLHKCPF